MIDIEIQIRNTGDMRDRSLYYWTKLYEGQLHERGDVSHLASRHCDQTLDFVEIPNDRVHTVFQLRNQDDGVVLTNHLTLHFLELPKLTPGTPRKQSALVHWLTFLKAQTIADREVLVPRTQPGTRMPRRTCDCGANHSPNVGHAYSELAMRVGLCKGLGRSASMWATVSTTSDVQTFG